MNEEEEDHVDEERSFESEYEPEETRARNTVIRFCSSASAVLPHGRFKSKANIKEKVLPLRSLQELVRYSGVTTSGADTAENFPANTASVPPYVDRFCDLIKVRSVQLQKAASAVCRAYEVAYGDQIESFSNFMISALKYGLIPHQPQTTLFRALKMLRFTIEDDTMRLAKFVSMLPGFDELDVEDQRIMLSEKYFLSFLLHRTKYIYRGECYYYLAGEDQLHCGRYLIDSLGVDPGQMHFILTFASLFNDIGLTLTETYLLLAAAAFAPEVTNVANKSVMGAFHSLYQDAFFYLLGHRVDEADRAHVFGKVERLMELFPVACRISVLYVNSIEMTVLPLRSRCIQFQDCLRN